MLFRFRKHPLVRRTRPVEGAGPDVAMDIEDAPQNVPCADNPKARCLGRRVRGHFKGKDSSGPVDKIMIDELTLDSRGRPALFQRLTEFRVDSTTSTLSLAFQYR